MLQLQTEGGWATVYLDLQGHQSDHSRAEGQWRGEVRAQVEKGEPVGYTRRTDHTHDLAHKPTTTLKKHPRY